ncbi:hypothetical protein CEXT_555021 [Caerostris extrusa]|uniref:Uncharacterized protein n=1 Tax=Caerostris extrusa TaxID=172846 RepID=A0AAV4N666_CAEEX|nr:hypothetical protein CEXT_555021 [Caerostris extrusa]
MAKSARTLSSLHLSTAIHSLFDVFTEARKPRCPIKDRCKHASSSCRRYRGVAGTALPPQSLPPLNIPHYLRVFFRPVPFEGSLPPLEIRIG